MIIIFLIGSFCCLGQGNVPYSASFISKMGVDTVSIETYSMINNHLYGKAFVRVPEDYISNFGVHFYPSGGIREINVSTMDSQNSSVPFQSTSNSFPYQFTMNCQLDTCTTFYSWKHHDSENVVRLAAPSKERVGGWVPIISLIEWNALRLARSGNV